MKNWWRKFLPGGERLRMPSPSVTKWFWGLLALVSLPFMILDAARVYDFAVAQGATFGDAVGQSAAVFFAGALAYGLLGGMLFLLVALFTSVVIPDVVSGYLAVSGAVRRAPDALRRLRASSARAASSAQRGTLAFFRFLGNIPGRVAAMRAEDWFFALFMLVSLSTLAGFLYLGWDWAGAVVAWMPDWLADRHSFVFQLLIDWFMCIIPFSIAITIWSSIAKAVIRRLRNR